MQKNLALIAKYFKKVYKPTNNNLRTSSNSRNKNVDTSPRYKNDNQTRQFGNQRIVIVAGARDTVGSQECRKPKRVKDSTYHKEKMLLCKQAEKGVTLQAEQSDWLADTNEEIDEQKLEAHYNFMEKIEEVPTADSGSDTEPLEQVDSNVIPDSPDMCDDGILTDQNVIECDDECVVLANLISNLKLDIDENKKIQKQLKKANTSLAHELKECKSILTETSRTSGCDNGTEFKNKEMNQFCERKGIKREFSVARTPQQNKVAERKNRTLIEAARTMLADSKLPTTFWVEAVNTACYVKNRVLVTKPHNKTPYELFLGRKPALGFMRPFRYPVTILNTIDHLGSGPYWLFDIDALTKSMNYKPVVAGNQSNGNAGTKACDDAGKARMETVPGKDYILLPLWTADSPFSQSSKSSPDAGFKPSGDDEKKVTKEPGEEGGDSSKDSECSDQEKEDYVNSNNNFNDTSTNEVNAVGEKTSIELLDDPNMSALEDIIYSDDDEDVGAEADMNNLDAFIPVSPIPTTRVYKDHSVEQIIGDLNSTSQTKRMTKNLEEHSLFSSVQQRINHKNFQNYLFACFLSQEEPKKVIHALKDPSWIEAMQEELLQFKLQEDERGIMIKNKARLVSQGYTQEEGIDYDEMDVKSAILYGKIEEEVYVCQPPGFEDPNFPNRRGKIDNGDILYQVNPKVSHLHAMKRIFRYLKGQPKLGLWYPKDPPFDLVAYTDSDYAGASLDRKSTAGGCQFLGSRLISWQYKKQTVVANSTTEAEYSILHVLNNSGLLSTVKVKTVNGEVQLQALVDGKKIIVTEASVRRDLQLNDEEGMDFLPNATIFEELTRMGYEKLSQKLTFYNAFFSPQWKFLIHTILQCLSAKTTTWNEFSSTMASAIICLATNQKFNFSKYIFESMMKNLENVSGKFLMYLRLRRPKRENTEVPQPSGPIENVVDKAVNEEMDDSLVRAATTVSSLDAEQDRGNINKTQSKATLNEPSSLGTSSGSGPKRQETMGDTIAQTGFENVSKTSNDLLLVGVNNLEVMRIV
ncbi:ribonuclease H-like domain-containing protein [Tanacetum coccineum]|uniref:Ribonuclease H-like domain-containing protein n=1 Tax=Tanacetum coccineum TaxID=301880 RepID=A0ABQ4YAQ0_9ASTR